MGCLFYFKNYCHLIDVTKIRFNQNKSSHFVCIIYIKHILKFDANNDGKFTKTVICIFKLIDLQGYIDKGDNFGISDLCIYKGKVYNKGDKWDDGCDFSCECQEGQSGLYQCKAK